ncbi:hypothetical protein [Halorarum salinum]|uniref:Uncharacterized protein n=1 Tax=Halorarum salinum TaxID=2743089 RepID=A0A7D5LAN2_9EURY|nr:hypothetical protein [Halobaculum salinum]QLG62193.1 hypothetical protein HUG12_10795 [Halobaculum salinum]
MTLSISRREARLRRRAATAVSLVVFLGYFLSAWVVVFTLAGMLLLESAQLEGARGSLLFIVSGVPAGLLGHYHGLAVADAWAAVVEPTEELVEDVDERGVEA